jgi:hypothetical protein
MRLALVLFLMLPAFAQEPAKPDPQAAAPAKDTKEAASPAPAAEPEITGDVEVGYRWLPGLAGNFAEYRSVVNLGDGPKLLGANVSIVDPKKRLFDRIDAWGHSWGGDPYNTAHALARKSGIYRFTFDYRNIAYFNAVPSFANPFVPAGFDEQSFDLRRRMTSFQLDLLPGTRIIPYFAYDRATGRGRGIATWVLGATDEFPVAATYNDTTNNYRGGLRFELNKFHVTLEQGGTQFSEDDQNNFSGTNTGNRGTPVGGQTIVLNTLSQVYAITGSSIYSKGLATARPFSWLDLYGQFLFSQPKTSVNYTESATGNLVIPGTLTFYNRQQSLATGGALQPHSTGNAGFELRPLRRIRILESWMTDRFHDAAASLVAQQITGQVAGVAGLNYSTFVNHNQNEVDVFVDVTKGLTVRGGYRRVWGDATVLGSSLSQTGLLESGSLQRNIGLGGLTYRNGQKLTVHLDYEGAVSDHIYFRTSLNDYSRGRASIRYQIAAPLWIQASFQVLNNQNPAPDIRFDFQSRNNTVLLQWTPNSGKRVSVTAEYDRSTVRSDIRYLDLFFTPATSIYRDNAHTATSAVDFAAGRGKFTLGGSVFISSGSRPTRYYQPLARVSWPIVPHVSWNSEWRYYGFGEQFYQFEGFRTHLIMTGLRLTR